MLNQGITEMLKSKNAYLSDSFHPYDKLITTDSGLTTGITKSGTRFAARIFTVGSKSTVIFSKNGFRKYTLTVKRVHDRINYRKSLKIVSSLHNVDNPDYDIEMRVYAKRHLSRKGENNHPEFQHSVLEVNFAGNSVSEKVWPGKEKFENIGRLTALMSSLPPLERNDLNNFFYLLSVDPNHSMIAWNMVSKFPGKSASEDQPTVIGGDSSSGSPHPMLIRDNWQYWCGVGTIGADVVFTIGGSVAYGIACGVAGEAGDP